MSWHTLLCAASKLWRVGWAMLLVITSLVWKSRLTSLGASFLMNFSYIDFAFRMSCWGSVHFLKSSQATQNSMFSSLNSVLRNLVNASTPSLWESSLSNDSAHFSASSEETLVSLANRADLLVWVSPWKSGLCRRRLSLFLFFFSSDFGLDVCFFFSWPVH